MRLKIKQIVFLIFLFLNCSLVIGQEKILVLHSYHQGLEWTDNITNGINSIFSPFGDKYELHFDYLDTKRNTTDEYYEQLRILFEAKSKKIKYSAIIISDNNALNFIKANREKLFDDIPIIFCGVNNYSEELIEGINNITGVEEKTDFDGTISLMLKLHPNTKRIFIVNDFTTTGHAIKESLQNILPKYQDRVKFEFYENFLLETVGADLESLGGDDLIYILTFNRDKEGKFIAYQYGIIMIVQAVKVPIYGSWDFYLGKGIVGGNITSGVWQGQEAARMTLDVLNGKDINSMPVRVEIPNTFMFDYNQLIKHNIPIENIPNDAQIINVPPSFLDENKISISVVSSIVFLIMFVLIARNVDFKSRQKDLEAEKDKLDYKVKIRTKSLEEVNSKLKLEIDERIETENKLVVLKNDLLDANKTKDKFFSIIAHDLKNPFNSLLGLTGILRSEYDDYTEEEIKGMIKEIHSASHKTYCLLEDLLTWSSSQRGVIKEEKEEANLEEIINREIHVLKENAHIKNIELILNIDVDEVIFTDKFMFSTVIRNLITNAIKFTPNGGKVEIYSKKENDSITLCVSDTGVGIDDSIKESLFRIDKNVSTRGTNNEVGTGLGLVLCKEFVDKLGGKIWLEDNKDKGTTFLVRLPKSS
ncbi:MAG: sensor histidine kinase [Melioribacteraceae bacterium]|nr:sensor histidine kinase [Melioribacteraceae bacterium]